MTYKNLADLPKQVRDSLPEHAQQIYLEAFNHAWEEYKDAKKRRDNASREETARKVAWATVKKLYVKDENSRIWKKKG